MPTSEPTLSNSNEYQFSDNITLLIDGDTFVMKILPFYTKEFEVIKIQIPQCDPKGSPKEVFDQIRECPIVRIQLLT